MPGQIGIPGHIGHLNYRPLLAIVELGPLGMDLVHDHPYLRRIHELSEIEDN